MRTSRFQDSLAVVMYAIALLPSMVAAQSSQWAPVMALPSGVMVRVQGVADSVQQGRFLHADDDRLTIKVATGPMDIPRTSVRRLYKVSERNVGRYALRGLVIGAAGGATLGALTAQTNKAQWSALMSVGWGTLGAAIGAINGLDRDRVLVYEGPTASK
jgi:hypothetical protein